MPRPIFSFVIMDNQDARNKVYEEIKYRKSRSGMWERIELIIEKWIGKNAILLSIKECDWIVQVNMPSYVK
jgi:hypothetical protein